jgi:hypothetical protein
LLVKKVRRRAVGDPGEHGLSDGTIVTGRGIKTGPISTVALSAMMETKQSPGLMARAQADYDDYGHGGAGSPMIGCARHFVIEVRC